MRFALYRDRRTAGTRRPLQPVLRALYEQAVRQQGPVVVISDLQALPDLPGAHLRALADARTLVCAGMTHEGQLVGILVVLTLGLVRTFSQDEQAVLQGLADQAALAVTNARLLETVQRELGGRKRTEETLAALDKASQAIVSTLNLESVLKLVTSQVKSLLGAEEVSVMLRDPASGELVFAVVAGEASQELVSSADANRERHCRLGDAESAIRAGGKCAVRFTLLSRH